MHKNFYDSFVLRNLTFKKLMEEIFERLNGVFLDVQALYIDSEADIGTVKLHAIDYMKKKFQMAEPDKYLSKLEVHLLRLFNPEFL